MQEEVSSYPGLQTQDAEVVWVVEVVVVFAGHERQVPFEREDL